MDTQKLMDVACPKIRDLGWAYYFVPETIAKGAEMGLDVVGFYFLGRGGVLGDVESPVVASAFGYFNPALVDQHWTTGRALVDPRTAALAYTQCAADLGRAKLADIEDLDAYCEAAEAVNAAADPVGLALYSGARLQPRADDAPARAMQLTALLRELRGSAHLVAVRASGLDAKTANFVKRPGDASMFGWTEDDAPEVDDDARARHAAAEAMTDDLVRPAYAALDDAGAAALLAGLDGIEAALVGP
ncbi:MAG: hypothetical protein JWM05_2815 [Acidimicrobiales bacterium]|nr:hypothetical protein [Acidimicrobiales bacterium]